MARPRILPIIRRRAPILGLINRIVYGEEYIPPPPPPPPTPPGEKSVFEEYGVPRPWIPATMEEFDSEVEKLAREQVEEWKRKGYSRNKIRMALEMASEWTTKMISWMTRFVPEEEKERIQKMIALGVFEKALKEVANAWLEKMGG